MATTAMEENDKSEPATENVDKETTNMEQQTTVADEPTTKIDESQYNLQVKPDFILESRHSSLPEIQNEFILNESRNNNNKKRPRDARIDDSTKLCAALVRGEDCTYTGTCKYSHDIQVALADRPADISVEAFSSGCPTFESLGHCPFGLTCRFGSSHIHMTTGANVKKPEAPPPPIVLNTVDKSLVIELRKKKYAFKCPKGFNMAQAAKQQGDEVTSVKMGKSTFDPLPSKTRKIIDFSNKVYIAPLTTVGNLPFRRVMKRLGADITCGEMAVAFNLLEGKPSEWALLKRHPEEDLFGVQIAAGHPDQFARTGELIESHVEADFVDLNLGCPIDLICNRGAGASLMRRDHKLRDSLHSLSYSLRKIPFTVKMRTGWDEKKPFAHELVQKIQNYKVDGLAAIMIHGRSRLQRYSKDADWEYIDQVLKNQSTDATAIPIIGNGDIMSYQDYETKVLGHEGLVPCAMLGRGALIKPWLPTEIKEKRQWDISSSERFDILKDFVRFGLEHWGSDQQGVNNCRRFLLEWLSFLHRYVPIGILEQTTPQRMNQRPPKFVMGRNDLETLFLSDHCSDWVRISEMLLGPVPEGFRFEPKHKARAYKPEG